MAFFTSQTELEHHTPDHKRNGAQSHIRCHSSVVKSTEHFGEICLILGERSGGQLQRHNKKYLYR